ncbi:MAG: homoserine dehydrogenase [Oscillospiraceae bacterium]|nr:homoserine dehydrogenase [Oscillospiraceae bacterium]
MIYIAILGHGVVGSGVAELMRKNADPIARKAGIPVAVKHILDIRDFPSLPYSELFTKRFEDILEDGGVRIVVETIGGLNPAYDFVKRCLLADKSVVTSNKELVATHGDELLAIARERNLNFLFEASVGGGIPILRPLDQCLAANEVYEIAGILNGTTNFMLTKMIETGMSFDDALALAQQLGYAERDPSADVDGHDACRKICILASLAFGKHLYPNQVYTEGIRQLTPTDVKYASAIGRVIKLIGRACKREDGRLYAVVAPMLLPKDNLLAEVNDVFNGIMVRGDAIGDVVFYGRGAGKEPTASAVVADVIDEVKHLSARKYLFWEPGEEGYAIPHDDAESAMLVRVAAGDKQAVTAVFGQVAFIAGDRLPGDELAFVTPVLNEKELNGKLAALPVVSKWRLY